VIKDRFTLILGKFKKDLLKKYQNNALLKVLENLNLVPLENFINIFQNHLEEFSNLKSSLKLIETLNDYRKKSRINLEIITQFISVSQTLDLIFKYNILIKKKSHLLIELKISKNYKRTSNVAAITDLIKKLSNSITSNKKNMRYIEEDYIIRKNQMDQIKTTLTDFTFQIQELNKKKKGFFSQINKITRKMENLTSSNKNSQNNKEKSEDSLSNAEKIQALQKKARETQFQINEIKSKMEKTRLKLEKLEPQFKIYKDDYQKIANLIQKEELRVKDLQKELNEEVKANEEVSLIDFEEFDLKTLRTTNEVEREILSIESDLSEIEISKSLYNSHTPYDLSKIKEELIEIEKRLQFNENQLKISTRREEILDIFQNFRKLETIINDVEKLVNVFLLEINLNSHFIITISEDNQKLFLQLNFIRNDKEEVLFDSLTTPEKIYFVIVFFISIQILQRSENVILSNLIFPNIYNKRGSIYRTIKKILPLFDIERSLRGTNLIFIMSNLEQKDIIKNLKVIKLEES